MENDNIMYIYEDRYVEFKKLNLESIKMKLCDIPASKITVGITLKKNWSNNLLGEVINRYMPASKVPEAINLARNVMYLN